MGSCVPPRLCAGNLQSYRDSQSSIALYTAVQTVSAPDDPWIERQRPEIALQFTDFESLASSFWSSSVNGPSLGSSPEEDTRVFMLERLIAQALSVVKDASKNELHVYWANSDLFIEEHIPPDPNARKTSDKPLNGAPASQDAVDQIGNFANYLYQSVATELGHDPVRLQSIIDLVGTCLEGIGNVIYVAKALTGFPRPSPPRSLPTPLISTWPGGHAFFSGAIAALLFVVITKGHMGTSTTDRNYRTSAAKRLAKMAQQIAENRESAALHFKEDSKVGLEWGFKVMSKVLAEAKKAATPSAVPGTLGDLYSLVLRVA